MSERRIGEGKKLKWTIDGDGNAKNSKIRPGILPPFSFPAPFGLRRITPCLCFHWPSTT